MGANIRNSIMVLKDEIASYRHSLHENPQTSFEETFASGLIQEKLKEWNIPFEAGLGKTGVVATIKGRSNKSGKAIGLRADMDALDIIEDPAGKPHASKNPGKMHACGHDGHTAMLLGTAKYLSENNDFDGTVHLIFQPAEEGDKGAHAMMEDGLFERFPCNQIFAVHNWPMYPKGTCGTCPGPIMACSDNFYMTIKGSGGHAALPHLTVDPIAIGAQVVDALQTIVSRNVSPIEPAVVSITNFNAGTGAHNIIPDEAKIQGSVRTYSEDVRAMIKERIHSIAKNIAEGMGGSVEYRYDMVLDPTINDAASTEFCAQIAKDILGDANVDDKAEPSMGGEDFGAMLLKVPGCYVMLGQGVPDEDNSPHNQGLHTPRYDFNDDIIPIGIEYFVRVVEASLKAS